MAERRTKTRPDRRIADHGVIGNLSTMALVALDGTIDYLCWPNFDSPTLFASLLDARAGGAFELAPEIAGARVLQTYLPESNVLVTRWLGEEASAEITDLMTASGDAEDCTYRLIRRLRVTRGTVRFRLRCAPRFDYARIKPKVTAGKGQAVFTAEGSPGMRLWGPVAFTRARAGAEAVFTLEADETLDLVLDEDGAEKPDADALERLVAETTSDWQAWAAKSTYKGRWRDAVTRSALVLKLMTSRRHGSIVAAATFGLPETPKGSRNWDYRATWIRDASFTVYALMRLGYQDEAMAFTRWTADRAATCSGGRLHVMYAVDGSPVPEEESLPHLAGHNGASPVRIGNAAATQLQLDIYGALLDSIYLSNKYGDAISNADWHGVRQVVDYVCENWHLPDAGIWEMRSRPTEHLHSRLMCWVAVDRAIRLASKRSLSAPFETWIKTRNEISEDIWSTFWNEKAGHFVRSKDGTDLDGSMLMMPLVRFVGATDPAWLATLDAIGDQLADDGLVMRYDREDGLDGKEGSFAACAFWHVECLARAGRVRQARNNFEKLLLYGNHLQLYAEEFDVRAEFLGNFPQALTHLALISAAFALDRALDGRQEQWRA
ncbi:GH15 family glucan-1,4-alpha-glucosidase [Inquilinus ginsengisoli]|uniref:GH15 family glucan-1,4-alpha-glucosidase n=1 Tax=Inquilinus ginsengisoli TaxID=363840 RepID=A0ABU1JYS9_9PROT|nr:glycoside hydrolase family 15 protein [Inquilinus ginsengisoli]MDR6292695.1 GH15 family glucan-1,4-alpha-glucosidase [Inquilinus ginsengisoli]